MICDAMRASVAIMRNSSGNDTSRFECGRRISLTITWSRFACNRMSLHVGLRAPTDRELPDAWDDPARAGSRRSASTDRRAFASLAASADLDAVGLEYEVGLTDIADPEHRLRTASFSALLRLAWRAASSVSLRARRPHYSSVTWSLWSIWARQEANAHKRFARSSNTERAPPAWRDR